MVCFWQGQSSFASNIDYQEIIKYHTLPLLKELALQRKAPHPVPKRCGIFYSIVMDVSAG